MVDRNLTAHLNKLIKVFLDAEKAYDRAIELTEDERLKATYRELREKRREFADEIQTLVTAIGEQPADSGTVDMSVEIALNEIQLPFSSDRDKFILNAVTKGIDDSMDDFDTILSQELPLAVRSSLESIHELYKADQQQLHTLRKDY